MFDARSILDVLVRGGGQPQGAGPGAGADIFRDLLGQLAGQGGAPQAGNRQPPPSGRMAPSQEDDSTTEPRGGRPMGYDDRRSGAPMPRGGEQDVPPGQMGGGSLEDLLRSILGGGQGGPGARQSAGHPARPARRRRWSPGSRSMSRMVGQDGQGQGGPGARAGRAAASAGAGNLRRARRCGPPRRDDRRLRPGARGHRPGHRTIARRARGQAQGADRQQSAGRRRGARRARRADPRHQRGPLAGRQRRQARRLGADRRARLQGLPELSAGLAAARRDWCQAARGRRWWPLPPAPASSRRP